jgi:hypothetical protein
VYCVPSTPNILITDIRDLGRYSLSDPAEYQIPLNILEMLVELSKNKRTYYGLLGVECALSIIISVGYEQNFMPDRSVMSIPGFRIVGLRGRI